jgi:hypothetical protein
MKVSLDYRDSFVGYIFKKKVMGNKNRISHKFPDTKFSDIRPFSHCPQIFANDRETLYMGILVIYGISKFST